MMITRLHCQVYIKLYILCISYSRKLSYVLYTQNLIKNQICHLSSVCVQCMEASHNNEFKHTGLEKLTYHNRPYKSTDKFSRPFICTTRVLRIHSLRTTSVLCTCVIFFVRILAGIWLYHIVFSQWFLIALRAKFKAIGQAMKHNGK